MCENVYSVVVSMSCNFGPLLGLAVKHHAHDGNREAGHAHDGHRVAEYENGDDSRHGRLGISEHLQGQRARVLGDQEVGQVDQVGDGGIPEQEEDNVRVYPGLVDGFGGHVAFDVESEGEQNAGGHWRHVEKQVHGVKLLGVVGEQNPLDHRLQCPTRGGPDADQEPEKVEKRLAVAGQDDSEDDGEEGGVDLGGLLLAGDYAGENGGEKRRGGADGLVEGDGEVAEGGVAAHDGEAEDGAEGQDLEELPPGDDVLTWHDLEEVYGDVAVGGAGDHVEHCEEDWVAVAVVAEEVLVQQQHSDVG